MSFKSPAFQMYVNDFLGSAKVGMMNAQEIGIYTMLLFLDWQECGFAFDNEELSRWCRVTPAEFSQAWKIIGKCFQKKRGRMFSPRLELERGKQAAWREKSAKGGRANKEGWLKGGSTVVNEWHSTPLPSPSPITTKQPMSPKGDEYTADFDLLWKAYPKRGGPNNKRAAFKAYRSRLKAGVSSDLMFEGVKRYRTYLLETGKEGTEFVQMASTFLGPNRNFLEQWDSPPQKTEVRSEPGQATKIWQGLKRTKCLFSVNAEEWQANMEDMVEAGEAESVEWLRQFLRKVNRTQLQNAQNDHFAIEHIREVLPSVLRIA